jgi:hypothetical protein
MIRPIISSKMDAILKTDEIVAVPQLKLFPNPTQDIVTIRMEGGNYSGVEVYSIHGQLIIDTQEESVNLVDQPNGMYFFRIKGIEEVYKIVKH